MFPDPRWRRPRFEFPGSTRAGPRHIYIHTTSSLSVYLPMDIESIGGVIILDQVKASLSCSQNPAVTPVSFRVKSNSQKSYKNFCLWAPSFTCLALPPNFLTGFSVAHGTSVLFPLLLAWLAPSLPLQGTIFTGSFPNHSVQKTSFSYSLLLRFVFFAFLFATCPGCGMLVPQPGIEPVSPEVEVRSL